MFFDKMEENMNWSERTVSDEIAVEKSTVNEIFVNYIDDKFYVNRRYQRKLVWEIDEKRLLIDSMLKKIPLPAILLVKYNLIPENKCVLEIVDGMQRLNAIISFILGEYGINYQGKICYFNPSSYNETFQLMMDKDMRLKVHEKACYLPRDLCLDFTRYQLPTIITGKNNETVDMIFSRINSTGRKISNQDLRQSMAVGEFPDLVRRIASDIRMDNTYDDHIRLCEIPQISVGHKEYGYGVDLNDIFWRRHDLINAQNVKESKDEEIIETLLATVLLDQFKKSKSSLDELYRKNSKLNIEIEGRIREIGKNNLEEKFKKVFDIFDMIFVSVNSDFSSYLFEKKRTKNKDEGFKVVFLALYNLISDGYIIVNYTQVAQKIKNAVSIIEGFTNNNVIDYTKMKITVDNLYNLLKPAFAKSIEKKSNAIVGEVNKRLSYSKIESQLTEFKIGISYFTSCQVNNNTIKDIAKTLVAMANISDAKEEGMLIIGIADSKKTYDDWYNLFKGQVVINNQHYIPGIAIEARRLCGGIDQYNRKLRQLIENEPISSKLKQYILETFEIVDYYDVEIVIFKSKFMGEISLYDNQKYIRHSSETRRI